MHSPKSLVEKTVKFVRWVLTLEKLDDLPPSRASERLERRDTFLHSLFAKEDLPEEGLPGRGGTAEPALLRALFTADRLGSEEIAETQAPKASFVISLLAGDHLESEAAEADSGRSMVQGLVRYLFASEVLGDEPAPGSKARERSFFRWLFSREALDMDSDDSDEARLD